MVKLPDALMKPDAYDERVEKIKLVQTHISWVFLTGKYAYKIKKPVNFGFLDFSTLEKRKFYCQKELELNRRLCPDIYIGVLPVTDDGKINGSGKAVEYALKMKQMPRDALMSKLLDENKINKGIIDRIAKIVADFHRNAETNKEISKYGSTETIEFTWNENFEQTKKFIGSTITYRVFNEVGNRVKKFISNNKNLFEKRVRENKIRWCHGDLHSGNIFIAGNRICIFDCIEFNPRLSCIDTCSDAAFFSMDLDFHNRHDLSEYFVEQYVKYGGDKELAKLLNFYKCYRAYVRGKVTSLKLNDKTIDEEEKREAMKTAKKYFELSHGYSKSLMSTADSQNV